METSAMSFQDQFDERFWVTFLSLEDISAMWCGGCPKCGAPTKFDENWGKVICQGCGLLCVEKTLGKEKGE